MKCTVGGLFEMYSFIIGQGNMIAVKNFFRQYNTIQYNTIQYNTVSTRHFYGYPKESVSVWNRNASSEVSKMLRKLAATQRCDILFVLYMATKRAWFWLDYRPKRSYNKTNKTHQFLKFIFGIELYMFRTLAVSIIRSFNTVHTAIGICHTGYADCLLAGSWSR